MRIDDEFTVSVPIDQAWAVLTDLERVAPCLPGAQLTGRDGDAYVGRVTVKVGPVTSDFAGTATFVEKDDAAYRAVIDAKGRDARGAGNASARITGQLRADGSHTVVAISTDMTITGRLAQFGGGVIRDVSTKLLGQFVDRLEQELASPGPSAPPGAAGATDARERAAEPVPLDLTAVAGGAVAKRAVPALIVAAAIAAIVYVVTR